MTCKTIHLKDHYPFLGENGRDATMDIYLIDNLTEMNRQEQKHPCMLICPGGAYCFVSQREGEPFVPDFQQAGYHVFVLTYSVNCPFPTQLREVAACLELIYAHGDDWHCDTERVAIMGFSAGGHLAAHYSTMFDCPAVRQVFPDSKPVNATVLGYPVATADPAITHHHSISTLLGHPLQAEDDWVYFSCDRQVKETTPPAFLWHTATDNAVPVANSLRYAEALIRHGVPTELHIYPFGHHGLSTCDERTNDNVTPEIRHAGAWLPAAIRWLSLILHHGG